MHAILELIVSAVKDFGALGKLDLVQIEDLARQQQSAADGCGMPPRDIDADPDTPS